MSKLTYQKKALVLILLLSILLFACIMWILAQGSFFMSADASTTPNSTSLCADIYQNGALLQTIPLYAVDKPYTLTLTGDNGCTNVLEIRTGSIGIVSASCPDKLCVHQGFIDSSLLPITCLPNKVVIQVRSETSQNTAADIITY
ncbi:MAG: NusG domain II-containing protein [Lachnospiraceae bacterium]|nr:NusG domain II-containing protein [Lachnospiraceae bacterium]